MINMIVKRQWHNVVGQPTHVVGHFVVPFFGFMPAFGQQKQDNMSLVYGGSY